MNEVLRDIFSAVAIEQAVERVEAVTGAGLIVSEATAISPQGQGYADVPGLYGTEQLDGWKQVTKAVHAAGGTIFAQLWHVGRISDPSLLGGQPPVSSTTSWLPTGRGEEPQVETTVAIATRLPSARSAAAISGMLFS